jgi:hypothetical protein
MDVYEEVHELQGVFPEVTRSDFWELDNGNIGVTVTYETKSIFEDDFDVLIEFTSSYPDSAPNAWVESPDIREDCKHTYYTDDYGNTKICYLEPENWYPWYTSYDAAVMIKSWVYAYCNWVNNGVWDWEEAH